MRQLKLPILLGILAACFVLLFQTGVGRGQGNRPTSAATPTPRAWLQSPAIVSTAIAESYSAASEIEIGPWEYPVGVNPLTGLAYPSDEAVSRRNLIVKISNWPPRVRPQHAISLADLVYEYEAEGGVTRFAALYRNYAPAQVGSVRSARLLDIELISMYAALLAYSGTSRPIHDIYMNSNFRPLLLSPSLGDNCEQAGFCRDATYSDRGYEHTLFGDTRQMWQLATRRNLNVGYRANGFAFGLQPNAGGTEVRDVYIKWYDRTDVRWQYDASNRRYLRYADGERHLDAIDDSQLVADNLVFIQVPHKRRPDLFARGAIDESYELALWGRGPAYVLRDGLLFEGLWWRRSQNRGEALRLIFPDGDPILLKPGRTWVTITRSLDWAQISSELADPSVTIASPQDLAATE